MTETSWFWNGTTTGDATNAPYDANTEFANWSRKYFGVAANRNDAGVILGSGSESAQLEGLQVTQNGGGAANVLLNIGAALVHGTGYDNSAALTLSIAANVSGNPRIDTIVLRKSWALQTVRAAVLQGTPAASPVPPTLTQSDGVTWEIPIADIAVANGFVSILNANITSRALYTSAADGIYLDRLLNNSGAIRQTGDAVIFDTTADRAVNTTVLTNHNLPAGAYQGRVPIAGTGGRVLNQGIGYVRTAGAVTRGQYGYLSTTAGSFIATNEKLMNSTCIFLETTSGGGLALAYVDSGLKPNIGKLLVNARTATNALNIDNIPQFYSEYLITMQIASAIAATSETINIQLGSAGGGGARDVTAGNYYSYVGLIDNSVPVLAAVQNLGATAAWQITAPGSTATNPAHFVVMYVKGVNNSANLKVVSGHYFAKIANTNGNLFVGAIGGLWSNITKALEQINITTAGGNNMNAEVCVYGKDGITT